MIVSLLAVYILYIDMLGLWLSRKSSTLNARSDYVKSYWSGVGRRCRK